jgi:glycosyltransferase involved in cell wall biosynthesis
MILSILIPVIPERYPVFMKLHAELIRQVSYMHSTHPSLGLIEVLFDDSPSFINGGKSIGAKRNSLRQRAMGEYQCFCDDDDNIAPNFVESLVRMCSCGMDIVTFRCLFKNDYYWSLLNMSITNKKNQEANPDEVIQRTAWHVCPVKTSIARKESFDDELNHNEDWTYMQKILKHVKTETHTDMILTQYNHSEFSSEADRILKSQR